MHKSQDGTNGKKTSETNHKEESLHWLESSDTHISTNDKLTICDGIVNGILCAVSDGSFKSEVQAGTAGWIIENQTSTIMIKCTDTIVQSTGTGEKQCSYRSELIGLLALMTKIIKICMKYQIKKGNIHIGCDGKEAIDAVINKYEIMNPSQKNTLTPLPSSND